MHWGIKRQLLCLSFFSSLSRKRSNCSSPWQHFHYCCPQDCPLTKLFSKDWLLPVDFISKITLEEIHSSHKRATFGQELFFLLTSAHPQRSETWCVHSVSQRDGCPSSGGPSSLRALCILLWGYLHHWSALSLLSSVVKGKAMWRHSLASSLSHFALLNLLRIPYFLPFRYCTVLQLDTYKPKLHFPFQGVFQGLY